MYRQGVTPEFGLSAGQDGLFLSKVSFDPAAEEYLQKDYSARATGRVLYSESVSFSFEGEVKQNAAALYGMGLSVTLANACPAEMWPGGKAPTASTAFVSGNSLTMERESAWTRSVSGTIYPFGITNTDGSGDAEATV